VNAAKLVDTNKGYDLILDAFNRWDRRASDAGPICVTGVEADPESGQQGRCDDERCCG